jgi:hypothetical protein
MTFLFNNFFFILFYKKYIIFPKNKNNIKLIIFNFLYFFKKEYIFNGDWGWGLGIGDWGLGIGDWAQSPIPNPQSPIPIPNPH